MEFIYVDENNKDAVDLIHLFEYLFNDKLTTKEIVLAIKEMQKYVKITAYDNPIRK